MRLSVFVYEEDLGGVFRRMRYTTRVVSVNQSGVNQSTHQNAGSQYITGCASTGLGDKRDRDMLSLWSMLSPSSLM